MWGKFASFPYGIMVLATAVKLAIPILQAILLDLLIFGRMM